MKRVKLLCSIVGFIALFLLCGAGFRYLVTDDTASFTRVMMHDFYEESPDIDILFVGSSHCFCSLDPQITDRIFQKNTFVGGSSAQLIDGSLAMIREAAAHNDIEQVYLEMYYALTISPTVQDRTDMTYTYILSDYMRPSLNKLQFLLRASSKQYYSNSFIIARRNWEKLYDWPYIADLLQRKAAPAYQKYEFTPTSDRYYGGKGFFPTTPVVDDGAFYADRHFMRFNEDVIYEDWLNTFYEILDFCEREGIELTLFSSPMSTMEITEIGNYDAYIAFVNDLIKDRNVRYYDFNLCKETYFAAEESNFTDYAHLNAAGAKRFSKLFSEFFTGQIPEGELFYHSYAEKLQSLPPDVFGVLTEDDAENRCIRITPIGNADLSDVTIETVKTAGGKSTVTKENAADGTPISYAEGEDFTLEIAAFFDGTERTRVSIPFTH